MNSLFGYIMTFSAGILLSAILFVIRVRRAGLSVSRSLIGFLAGILCAALLAKAVCVAFYYPALNDMYGLGKWIRLIPGEFSFVGGCVGFCAGIVIPWLRQRRHISRLLDQWALPGCLLAAFARFSEIFLDSTGLAEISVTGLPDIEDGSLLARFPFAVPDPWGLWYFAVSTLTALLLMIICACTLIREKRGMLNAAPAGQSFCWTVFMMCVVRFFLELTRMESLIFFFVHIEQVLSALVMLGICIRMGLVLRKRTGRFPRWAIPCLLGCFVINGLTQFLLDKPWKFEFLMPEAVFSWVNANLSGFCYVIFLLTSVGLILICFRLDAQLRKPATQKASFSVSGILPQNAD